MLTNCFSKLSEFFNFQNLFFESVELFFAVIGFVCVCYFGGQWLWLQVRHNTVKVLSTALLIGCAIYLFTGDAFGAEAAPVIDGAGPEMNAFLICVVVFGAIICIVTGGMPILVVAVLAALSLICAFVADLMARAAHLFTAPAGEKTAELVNAETLQKAVENQARVTDALIAQTQAHAQFLHTLMYCGAIAGIIVLWAFLMRWLSRRERNQAGADQGRTAERVVYIPVDSSGRPVGAAVPVNRQISGAGLTEVRNEK